MASASLSKFFAVLSLACWAGSLAVIVTFLASKLRGAPWAERLLDDLGGAALWLASLVAVVCTCGSLYYSEIAGYTPCDLCWFQRICMYPLTVILIVAAYRRDRRIWRYTIVQAGVGAVIAIYHTQLQAFPSQSSFCPTTVPCTIRYVWEFGFVSLPFMALSGFVFILLMLGVSARSARIDDQDELGMEIDEFEIEEDDLMDIGRTR